MTISDILSAAADEIIEELETLYGADSILAADFEPDEYFQKAAGIVLAMDRVRLSEGFDLPPVTLPPDLPSDPLAYVRRLLIARQQQGDLEGEV